MDIKVFESKRIRSEWSEPDQKWYFSVIDVIEVLTESQDPKDYWYKMKKREKLSGIELSTICRRLKLESSDGKRYATDCANTEGLLRIIQSIPSPKAEPFKMWLAKVGYERMQEISTECCRSRFEKLRQVARKATIFLQLASYYLYHQCQTRLSYCSCLL